MPSGIPTLAPSRAAVERAAAAEGLIFLGIAPLDRGGDYERFRAWLAESRHGGMAWLERHDEARRDSGRLLPGARTALVLALPYHQGDRPWRQGDVPRVAQYARFVDYHRWLARRGEAVVERLRTLPGLEGAGFRVAVDTLPLLERALAARTARGFIGKNTCYIHPERGSWLLLGEILTTAALPADEPAPVDPDRRTAEGGCGACDLCQVSCPTGALDEAYRIDARKCLAYWTIEHRGPIPDEMWPWLGRYWFGCDLCQTACPYNWRARDNGLPAALPVRALPPLFDVATMDAKAYERSFGGTAMTRAKRNGLRRNALIAMFVTGDTRLDEAMELILSRDDTESPVGETLDRIRWRRQRA